MRSHARVPAHEILATLPFALPDLAVADDTPADARRNARVFSLDQHWLRGGYEPSLFAQNETASMDWRADFLRLGLPRLPADRHERPVDPELFWKTLAKFQSSPAFTVQRRLKLDNATFERCLDLAEKAQIIRRLPVWPSPKSDGRPRLYFRDSGLLHRLLDVSTLDSLGALKGRSWEGYVVESVVSAAPPRSKAWLYRDADTDEIDLVLRLAANIRPWAIEIKSGRRARLSAGFHRGAEAIDASRRIALCHELDHNRSNPNSEAMVLVDLMKDLQRA